MLNHDNCLLCGGRELSLHHSCTDQLVSSGKFDVFRCNKCGFVFTQGAPDAAEAWRFYESPEYISHTDSSVTLTEKLYQFVRKYMLVRKRRIAERSCGTVKGSLLDYGSGTGHFLNSMKQAGWDVKGIEINDNAREYSRSKFGLDVLPPGNLNHFPDRSLDCITMWHVAEHLYDIRDCFSEAGRILKPGGRMVVALPNCNSYDATHYKENWAAWDVPRHLWHFSQETFTSFAGSAGFSLIETRVLPFDVFYISLLSERQKGSGSGLIKGFVKGMWFSILCLFRRKKASSLVYVLRLKSS